MTITFADERQRSLAEIAEWRLIRRVKSMGRPPRCVVCGDPIPPGEPSLTTEPDETHYRACISCVRLAIDSKKYP